MCKCQNFCLFMYMYFIWNYRGFTCAIQVHSAPSCFVEFWLGLALVTVFFRIMKLSNVYVNDNDLDKFHRIIAALTGPPKAWPTRWRIVVPTYIQLCVNTCVIGIGSTRSTKTSMYLEFREIIFSHQTSSERPSFIIGCKQRNGSESFSYRKKPNKLFHSPGDLLPPIFW